MDMYLDSFDLSESTNLNRHKLHNTSLKFFTEELHLKKKKKSVVYVRIFRYPSWVHCSG